MIKRPGTKALCSSEIISSKIALNLLAIAFEQILYNTLHKEIGLNAIDRAGWPPSELKQEECDLILLASLLH
jgi:hypothetical protein